MGKPFAHQDACGTARAPLGLFINGRFHSYIDTKTDPHGDIAAGEAIRQHGGGAEALITCINHPRTAAVDCLICDPLDDE